MLSDREKHLMKLAMESSEYYASLDEWLSEVIDDQGHTVEQWIDWEADQQKPKHKV